MKAEIVEATGCPHGQVVIHTENSIDRAKLREFLRVDRKIWIPWNHGATYDMGPEGPYAMNFGWIESRKVDGSVKESTRQFYGVVALMLIFIAGLIGGAGLGRSYWALGWGLMIGGLAFFWASTRVPGPKTPPK